MFCTNHSSVQTPKESDSFFFLELNNLLSLLFCQEQKKMRSGLFSKS